jgi:hypothetical protein
MLDIKTRLGLTEKPFGGQMQRENYLRANDRDLVGANANRGQTAGAASEVYRSTGLYVRTTRNGGWTSEARHHVGIPRKIWKQTRIDPGRVAFLT